MSYLRHPTFYIRKHGFYGSVKVATLRFWRKLFVHSEWMYLVDLQTLPPATGKPAELEVVRCDKLSDVERTAINQMERFKSERELKRFLARFSSKGATLWVAKRNGEVVSVVWTLPQGLDGFYSIPVNANEVVFLAGEVFPPYRGQGLFGKFMVHVFYALKDRGYSRAYVKVSKWNESSRRSLNKTPSVYVGRVMTFSVGSAKVTVWRDFDRRAGSPIPRDEL